jgi:hypothetical protein
MHKVTGRLDVSSVSDNGLSGVRPDNPPAVRFPEAYSKSSRLDPPAALLSA